MKLRFDEQLSPRLAQQLIDLYPQSVHVHDVGLGKAGDRDVWGYARDHDLLIVTKDSDFADLAAALGYPPKVVWIRLGNCTTRAIERIIRSETDAIAQLNSDPTIGTLVLG